MAISAAAKEVIERPLDKNRIKQRDGGRGMTFDYIGAEYAIQLLNEAFDYAWDSRVFFHETLPDMVIVGLELQVRSEDGSPIVKQQFGSCNVNRGVDVGSAYKGAASDALKKCASQMGLALELYLDDVPSSGFKAPSSPAPAAKPTTPGASRPTPPPRPDASASRPVPPVVKPTTPGPVAPPRPPVSRETRVAPPGAGSPSVQRPSPPVAPPATSRPAPPEATTATSAARPNPFANSGTSKGITTTQFSAMTSLAAKKELSPVDLIALVPETLDDTGAPKQTFEELTHSEAIQVIKAAQLR